ncbi:MAG: VWA domain-containing protein [Nanoarchaeota archaeon]|nr:VWA domain-containing protein [Nanoarchaeota archaeon]
MIITFAKPSYLVLLAVLPLIIIIYFITLKNRRYSALKFANFDSISKIQGIDLISKNISILIISLLVSFLLVLSLAGTTIQRQIDSSSFSFVLAIDSSKSMEANDVLPTRFEAAKQSAQSFVDSTPFGTKIGVISFSGNAFIESDLTEDKYLSKQAILKIPLSSIGGTDIYEAVITGTNLLNKEDAKAIILLSDGRLNIGTISQVIDYANQHNVIVHTIGFGSQEGGMTSFGISKIDEDALKSLAFNTRGNYYRATNEEQLKGAYQQVIAFKKENVSFNLSSYLVLAALILFLIEYILFNTRYKILP